MSKLNAQHIGLLYNGYDISGRSRQFDLEVSYDEDDTTAFQDGVVNSEPGLQNAMVNLTAFFDPVEGQSLDALKTPGSNAAAAMLMILFGSGGTPDEGDVGFAGMMRQFKMNLPAPSKGKLTLESTFKNGSTYKAEFGTVIDYATITNTKTGSTVDMAAAGADGLIAYLMVFTPTDTDSYEVKIQDSPDDSTWADYLTFSADGQTRTGERATESGSVDRYWRVVATRTGAAADNFGYAVMAAKQ